MEAFTGGQVDFDTKTVFKQSLGCHQVQRIEAPARIMVDKEINIAFGISLVAGR
jgi:hypothetical protein